MTKLSSLTNLMILFLVFMSFKSCKPSDKSNELSIDDFPMTVGSQWTYVRTDTLIRQIGRREPTYVTEIETVTIEVVRTDKKKKKEIISKWVRTFNAEIDTQNVIFNKDTLEFMYPDNPAGSFFTFKIPFPLKVGNRWYGWYGEPPRDSFKVVQEESLEVPAGKFGQVYLIERGIFIPNNGGYYKCWIVPEIGIVKMSRWSQNTLGREYEVEDWDLIGYDIKK